MAESDGGLQATQSHIDQPRGEFIHTPNGGFHAQTDGYVQNSDPGSAQRPSVAIGGGRNVEAYIRRQGPTRGGIDSSALR
eukprot:6415623-Karenia_brevis.AAC.1